jgi:hypothetical protein
MFVYWDCWRMLLGTLGLSISYYNGEVVKYEPNASPLLN